MSTCRSSLEEDDLRQVSYLNTWEHLQRESVKNDDDFGMLAPAFIHLKTFVDAFTNHFSPHIKPNWIWGMMVLSIKARPPFGSTSCPVPGPVRNAK